jgi:hypothetical protein
MIAKDDVPTLDVRFHVDTSCVGEHRGKALHGELIFPADVDTEQKSDVLGLVHWHLTWFTHRKEKDC